MKRVSGIEKKAQFQTIVAPLILAAILWNGAVLAGIPQAINYQGFLQDSAGDPVDGMTSVTFSLYTSSGVATPIWTGTADLLVDQGFFEYDLTPTDVNFVDTLYLGISVNGGEEMAPRKMLTSVPYAYRAESVENDQDTLAQMACSAGEIPKWTGSAWLCSADDGNAVESDPTVLESVKDGVGWGEISGIPSGFADGVDNSGISAETDPTVPEGLKDGISWGEVLGIPPGFIDGIDDVGDDDWVVNGGDMYANVAGNVGIGTTSPQATLDIVGRRIKLEDGDHNVFIGGNADAESYGGQFNTGVGYMALEANTDANGTFDGYANTAFGANALMRNTSGSENIAVGGSALGSNTTGDLNTAIGNGALPSLTTGRRNIAIGASAGSVLSTGSNNIYIGSGTYASAPGDSNRLNIGEAIFGDLSENRIGINWTNPSYTLHVNGDIGYTGSLYSPSDLRLKETIVEITSALEIVKSLRGVSYQMKNDPSKKQRIGLIAQEVDTVLPELVTQDKGGYYSVDYPRMVAVLVQAIKELAAQVESNSKP